MSPNNRPNPTIETLNPLDNDSDVESPPAREKQHRDDAGVESTGGADEAERQSDA